MGSFQSIKTTVPLYKKGHIYSNNGNPQPCVASSWVTKGYIKAKAETCMDPSRDFAFPVQTQRQRNDLKKKKKSWLLPHTYSESWEEKYKLLLQKNVFFFPLKLTSEFFWTWPWQEKNRVGEGTAVRIQLLRSEVHSQQEPCGRCEFCHILS